MKVAVILSGCGVFDGAEIHESVLTLLALSKNNVEYRIFAPDKPQAQVIDHLTGKPVNESRNVLVEAARIARGDISPLSSLDLSLFDAILFPGGFGVAKNLCTYAFDGIAMEVDPDISRLVIEASTKSIPIVAMCISPMMIAKILGKVMVTVGDYTTEAIDIVKLGASHIKTDIHQFVIDHHNKIVTAPCYMVEATVSQVADNIEKAVVAMINMVKPVEE